MFFLCATHREQLLCLPQNKISEYWLNWMLEAGGCYERADWERAGKFAGSALDLAVIAINREDVNHQDLVVEATLSTIYTMDILSQRRQYDQASSLAARVQDRIQQAVPEMTLRNCQPFLNVIADSSKHYDFFTDHLSLPLEQNPEFAAHFFYA